MSHVIIIEDDPDLRTLWTLILEFNGVSSQVISPGEVYTLPTADWKRATIVVTDWIMGDISGADVLKHAMQQNPTVKCHVLTAMINLQDEDIPVGVQLWLKPTMISTIIQEARHDE